MAEKKISELNVIGSITGSNPTLVIVQGSETLKIDASTLAAYTSQWSVQTGSSNTFTATQNFNGAVFLNGDINVVGNLIGGVRNEINGLEAFTSSLRNEVNGIEAYTASLKGTTLISGSAQISALGFSAATNGTVSSSAQITELPYIHSTTSSLNVFTGSVQSEVNALKIATSSYVVNSLTSSFVSYGILSQSFANFTSSVVNLHNDVNIISSSLVINSSGNFIRKQSTGDKDLQIRADSGVGISLTSNASLTWRIDTAGNIVPQGNYEIENNSGTKVFNSLAKIHTYTGSIGREEISGIEAYTASLKGAIEVSGQNVNVLGMLTAQQFNVTYVSSSTMYQSGSTKFGDTSDDRHEFTGSILVGGEVLGNSGLNQFTSSQNLVNLGTSVVTGSLNAQTGSQDLVNLGISSVTGSLIGITNGLMAFTAALDSTYATDAQLYPILQATQSLELHSGSMVGITNGLMALTASFKAASIVSSSQQIIDYNTFAVTASANTFYGNQRITGSLDVSGSITGSLKGNVDGTAAHSTNASNIALLKDNTDTTLYPVFSSIVAADAYSTLRGHASGTLYYNGLTQQLIVSGGGLVVTGSANITGSITITSGSITMPNRPAFRIVGTGGEVIAPYTLSGSKVSVDYNQGNHFNTTNGLFTAPIAGLYQVNVVIRTNSNTNSTINQLIVYKSGSLTSGDVSQIMIEFGPNTSMNHAGGSTISYLDTGDTLKAVVAVGTCSFDGNNNFSVAYIG